MCSLVRDNFPKLNRIKTKHYISFILKPQTNRIFISGGIPSSLLVKDYFILIEGPFMLVPL